MQYEHIIQYIYFEGDKTLKNILTLYFQKTKQVWLGHTGSSTILTVPVSNIYIDCIACNLKC